MALPSALVGPAMSRQPSAEEVRTEADSGMADSPSRLRICVWSSRSTKTTQPINTGAITGADTA